MHTMRARAAGTIPGFSLSRQFFLIALACTARHVERLQPATAKGRYKLRGNH